MTWWGWAALIAAGVVIVAEAAYIALLHSLLGRFEDATDGLDAGGFFGDC